MNGDEDDDNAGVDDDEDDDDNAGVDDDDDNAGVDDDFILICDDVIKNDHSSDYDDGDVVDNDHGGYIRTGLRKYSLARWQGHPLPHGMDMTLTTQVR